MYGQDSGPKMNEMVEVFGVLSKTPESPTDEQVAGEQLAGGQVRSSSENKP